MEGNNLILAKLADIPGSQQGNCLFTQRLTVLLSLARGLRVGVTGAVAELQRNLARIGYFCGAADGDFGLVTEMALKMFKQHMFSGSRQTSSGADGRLDLAAAQMLKHVLGEVTPAPVA